MTEGSEGHGDMPPLLFLSLYMTLARRVAFVVLALMCSWKERPEFSRILIVVVLSSRPWWGHVVGVPVALGVCWALAWTRPMGIGSLGVGPCMSRSMPSLMRSVCIGRLGVDLRNGRRRVVVGAACLAPSDSWVVCCVWELPFP